MFCQRALNKGTQSTHMGFSKRNAVAPRKTVCIRSQAGAGAQESHIYDSEHTKGYRRYIITELMKHAVGHAQFVCSVPYSHVDCVLAWDLVADYEHALRHLKDEDIGDPVEAHCSTPVGASDLECRVYDI